LRKWWVIKKGVAKERNEDPPKESRKVT
jgi:hypothetical protein